MKELNRGKYELPLKWSIDNAKWIIIYDVVENGETLTKQIPLHPNCYNDAKVGEVCTFYIHNCPNLHNNGEMEDFAIVGNTSLSINEHIFSQIIGKSKLDKLNDFTLELDTQRLLAQLHDKSDSKKTYTEAEVKEILKQTLKIFKNGNKG